jgi:CsoR family transcriptional regulator, copper-sensing transcriptional repressor
MKPHIKKRALHRAKILEGQLRALTKAIGEEEYCVNLLRQSLSVQNSLKSLDGLLLENHLGTHVKDQLRKKTSERRAISELLEIFSLSKK